MYTRAITHIHTLSTSGRDRVICSFITCSNGDPQFYGDTLASWLKAKVLHGYKPLGGMIGIDYSGPEEIAIPLMSHIQALYGCEVTITGDLAMDCDYEYHLYYDDAFVIQCIDRLYSNPGVYFKANDFVGQRVVRHLNSMALMG